MRSRIGVVIPTRNRKDSLLRLLRSLNGQNLIPDITLIVDSSDKALQLDPGDFDLNVKVLRSNRRSAAHQRNLGIEQVIREYPDLDYISFLDDDVEIPVDYLEKTINHLKANTEVVGVSGIARAASHRGISTGYLSGKYLSNHAPGTISRSAINVSPSGLTEISEVEWLIGCSCWKRLVFYYTVFEDDFEGQSLFEDVIFSYKANRIGKLVVDPSVIIGHHLNDEGRPNLRMHYQSWVVNRARIFDYSDTDFSRIQFFSTLLFIIFKNLPFALLRINRAREKVFGILSGIAKLVA